MKFLAIINNKEILIETIEENGYNFFIFPEGKSKVEYNRSHDGSLSLLVDDKFYRVDLQGQNGNYTANVKGTTFDIQILEEWKAQFSKNIRVDKRDSYIEIKSPMPGKIVRINVKKGDQVKKNQGIIVVEAMKMENELSSPVSGVVKKVKVNVGDVAGGQDVLVVVAPG